MYLLDTSVISETRRGNIGNSGVVQFLRRARREGAQAYISVITLGELRRGVDLLHYRGVTTQAVHIEDWLTRLVGEYSGRILDFTSAEAQVWGRLCVPDPHHRIDKQIAATALVYGLTVVTRNVADFANTGVSLLNPFSD